MTGEYTCKKCGTVCEVDGDFPEYFCWCDECRDYADGFDLVAFSQDVAEGLADNR